MREQYEGNPYLLSGFIVLGIRFAVILFGLTGNILSIITWSRPNLKSTSSVVLVALAVTDTFVILCSIWFELPLDYHLLNAYNGLPVFDLFNVIYLHNYYIQWSFVLSRVIYKMAETSSLYLTVIITLERYICICHPFWFQACCSYSRICKSVVATIFLSIAYHMSKFWETQLMERTYIQEEKRITLYIPHSKVMDDIERSNVIYFWMFMVIDYLLPLTCIVVLNIITFIKLKRMYRNRREISDEQRNENKLTTMMLYVILEFLVFTSVKGFITVESLFPKAEEYSICEKFLIRQLRDTFNTLNSSVNVVTYFSSWLPFRRTFMKMFCSKIASTRNTDRDIDLQDLTP